MVRSIKPEFEIGHECFCPACQSFCKYEQVVRELNEKESVVEYLFVCQNLACKNVYKAGNNIPLGTIKI